jgi:RNA polymerase sigma factor (sigma-70 family)
VTDKDEQSGRVLERFREEGDPVLFEQFEALNRAWLTRFVARQPIAFAWSFDHQAMAGDILHDIYFSTSRYTYRGGPPFRAWIRRLARNKMLKTLQKARSVPAALPADPAWPHDRGAGDPMQRLLFEEEGEALLVRWWIVAALCMEGVNRLEPGERRALALHDLDGLSYRDLGRRLDLSVREAGNTLKRARRKVAVFVKRFLKHRM